jgi:hypothetical protein
MLIYWEETRVLKENAEAVVAASRETALEVSANKTKYVVMSRDQNAGRIHSVRLDNSTFERVEKFLTDLPLFLLSSSPLLEARRLSPFTCRISCISYNNWLYKSI